MSYNMANFTNATNVGMQFAAINSATNGYMAALSLLAVWVIFVMLLLRVSEPAEAIAAASAVSMVYGFILSSLNALNVVYAWAVALILALSLTALAIKSR